MENVILPSPERLEIICNTLSPLTAQMDFFGTRPMSIWLGLTLLLGFLAWSYSKQLGWPVVLAWTYFAGYALALVEFPAGSRGCYERAFEATAGMTYVEITLLPLTILLLPKRYIDILWRVIPFLIIIDLPAIWLGRNGLMIAPSFDTAFMAMALPFLASWPLTWVVLATIAFTHGSTALLVLGAQLFVYVAASSRGLGRSNKLLIWCGVAMGFAALIGLAYYKAEGGHVFARPVRFAGWSSAMSFWLYGVPGKALWPLAWDQVNWYLVFFGLGSGSFTWIGMMLAEYKPPFDTMMHCDWLQIPNETGLIGLGLFLGVCWRAIRLNLSKPKVLSALGGVAACMLTYHPFRFMPTMLLIALIAREALYAEDEIVIRS